jgi:histidine-specific SAM-dependent methyltransferase
MLPTAFIVMPFSEPFEGVFAKVICPELENRGFIPVRADRIPASSDIRDDIITGIQDASLVIVEASELNANVYFEFGLAVSARKEFLLLARRDSKLPFDTQRWRHLTYDPAQLESLKSEFGTWIENTNAFKSNDFGVNSRLSRGEIFSNIVDACIFMESDNVPFEARVLSEIRSGSMLSCAYSYYTEIGSGHWLRLCNDPLYTVFQDSVRSLERQSDRLFSAMGDAFVKQSPDFISLGPGNGQKDRVLLRSLFRRLRDRNLPANLFYYPFDISHSLISTAVHTVSNDYELRPQIKVKAILGDFARLQDFSPVYDFRSAPNIFSFLGNTLGNISQEVVFLQKTKTAMRTGDVLLLEVRLKTDVIRAGGRDDDQYGLSFAPLAMLGVPFERSKFQSREESSVSQISRTKTLAVHYKSAQIGHERFQDIFLSCVNYYDRGELKQVLEGTTLNFEVLDIVEGDLMVIFVLRKR